MVQAIEKTQEYQILDPSDAFYPTMPPINIELSSRCNFKCPYCANPTLVRDYEPMSDEVLDSVIEQAAQNKTPIVALHGVGEPLLRKDLEQILRKLSAKGSWNGAMTTNGALLSLARMTSLYDAGLRFVYISVDTLDPELFKKTRGGVLEKVIGNIKAAAGKYPDVPFWVGLMNHREQLIGDAEKARFQEIFGDLPNIVLHVYENGRFPGAAEDWRHPDRAVRSYACYNPSAFMTIDARGKVSLCCADQNTEHVLGDVSEQSLRDIWYSKRNQDTFRDVALGLKGCPEVCYKCVMIPRDYSLEQVDPLYWGPLDELVKGSDDHKDEGDYERAHTLLKFALIRDPNNPHLKARMKALDEVTGQKTRGFFETYLSGGQ